MRTKLLNVFGAVIGLLMVSVSLFAHHGTAVYDLDHPITLEGNITNIEWSNPHILIYFDVKDDKGTIANWACELGPPLRVERDHGWTAKTFQIGDRISILGAPRKDGHKVVWLARDEIKKLPKD